MALLAITVHVCLLSLYWTESPSAASASANPGKTLAGDERTYLEAATRIAAGDPAAIDSLWPTFYAHTLAWAGTDLRWIQTLQTALLILAAWLTWSLARRWFDDGLGADLAGWLILLYPPLVAFAHYLWPEVLHLTLFLTALTLVSTWPRHPLAAAGAGITIALCLLTKSLLLPFVPVLAYALFRAAGPRRWLNLGAATGGLLATLLLATTLLGDVQLAGSGWFNMWVGLRDTSRVSLEEPIAGEIYKEWRAAGNTADERDHVARTRIRELIDERGVIDTAWGQLSKQWFRLLDRRSYLTAQLPGGPLADIGQGYRSSAPNLETIIRATSHGLYALILLGTAWGLTLGLTNKKRPIHLIATFLAYNLLLFLALHVKSRYRIQLLPFLFLLTGYTVDRLDLGQAKKWWIPATTLSALLLWFAFSQA
ncbi:MAG: hypothetical protein AAGD38_22185 [Acidobacteriota bacterium]